MPNFKNTVWSTDAPGAAYPSLQGDIAVDVAIAGAGITGVTVARLLKSAGLNVALVEARRVGKGESGKTTAHLTEVLDTRYHRLIANFGEDGARQAFRGQRAAIARITSFVEELNIACGLRRVPGYLYAETEDESETLSQEEAAALRLGLSVVRANDIPLPFPVARALRFEDQAQFDPRAYLLALAGTIPGGGSHIFEQTQVVDIEDGEPCRVVTENGTIRARAVIVATHAPIPNKVSLHTKLAAYRTYVVGVALPAPGPKGLFWDTADPYHYIRSEDVGGVPYLIVGGEDHKVGEQEDTTVPFERLEVYVARHFNRKVAPTDYRWSGQIIEPADGLPYIGKNAGSHHVYVATGYSGNGMTNGTLAAMILADAVRGVVNPWSKLFDSTRFKPLASAKAYVTENIDFPKHLAADRLGTSAHADDIQKILPGEGLVVAVKGVKLAVYRNARGDLSALSPVCTHLGCLVHWNTTEKSWDCPCHGSRFDTMGKVLNGPAITPLSAREISGVTDAGAAVAPNPEGKSSGQ